MKQKVFTHTFAVLTNGHKAHLHFFLEGGGGRGGGGDYVEVAASYSISFRLLNSEPHRVLFPKLTEAFRSGPCKFLCL